MASYDFRLFGTMVKGGDIFLTFLRIKDRSNLISSMSVIPEFLRNKSSETGLFLEYQIKLLGGVIDYRDWQIPLGRRFRALKLWSVIRTYGVKGLQSHIRKVIIQIRFIFNSMSNLLKNSKNGY
jgi:hypothetical protein